MRWKRRNGSALVGATSDRLSPVAAILRSEDQLLLGQLEVAIRPAVVGVALQLHQLLRRLVGALLRRIESRPVLAQLVATVHGGKYPARRVEGEPFPVAQTGDEALGRREPLAGPVCVVAPGAGAGLELGARLDPGRIRHAG